MAKNESMVAGPAEVAAAEQPKDFLTIGETAMLFSVSKSTLYKLTCKREIPFYRPFGTKVYFKRSEVEDWISTKRVNTDTELSRQAAGYCRKGGVR